MPRTWTAAGFNAHRQLKIADGDLREFSVLGSDADDVVLSTWSTLVIHTTDGLVSTGHQRWNHQLSQNETLHSPIGDQNGFLAGLDEQGRLYRRSDLPNDAHGGLALVETEASPSLAFLAMATNGRVVCTFAQAPNGNLVHVGEFATLDAFKAWHNEPTDPKNYPIAHHMVPGRPKQLVAGTASFAMLMNDDNLYTWGDPRHGSLARSTIEDGATPADKPGLVDALAELKLRKVSLGGWVGGAVSEDGAGYVWGSSMPGKPGEISCLKTKNGEHVTLIELGHDEEPDVVDLAIGDGHAVLVTSDGDTFVVGENLHGQLGLGTSTVFESDWTRVNTRSADRVVCGPKSTFLCLTSWPSSVQQS